MSGDPFSIKEDGGEIRDGSVRARQRAVDGDIVVSDSYRKHPHAQWSRFKNSSVLFYICVLAFAALTTRLYLLQMVHGQEYFGQAEGNRIRKNHIAPPRGIIYDVNGEKLAYNIPLFGLYVVPADLPKNQDDEDRIFNRIADILLLDHFDLVESFARIPRSSTLPIELIRNIPQEQVVQLRRESADWEGVYVRPVQQRTYSDPTVFSHIVGYTGLLSEEEYNALKNDGYALTDHVGKLGIEGEYESSLRGVAGEQITEVDTHGKQVALLDEVTPEPGMNIYLNIDASLQRFIWEELSKMVEDKDAPGGSVVVLDPQNGAVRALVSVPGYDNNQFALGIKPDEYARVLNDPSNPLFNRTIAGEYPSGSTFKLIVGAAALEEGIIDRFFSVISTGGLNVNGYLFPDWLYGGHGKTTIIHALAQSVNTFFYTVGGGYGTTEGLGLERLVAYGKKFGLATRSGIDIPGEKPGFLPSRQWKEAVKGERWYLGDTYHLAIGQGDILVTPLQVANYTAVIANGGVLYRPRIVEKVVRVDSSEQPIAPQVINPAVVSPGSAKIIQEGMRAAVTYGSARSLSGLDIDIAGKTGTAEFSHEKEPHAWFTGFAPYHDPELVVTVLVEEGEGGTLAATPIAKKIFEWYATNR